MPRTKAKTKKAASRPVVGVIMGSKSDWETMQNATRILEEFGVPFEAKVVSAHRTPKQLFKYAETIQKRGLKVMIAGAGGAAHLPGVLSALTTLPVLGVPMETKSLDGMDSLLSIVQMPGGVPVGTLAIGNAGAKNAGLLAVSILALEDKSLADKYTQWRDKQMKTVAEPLKTNSKKKRR